MPVGWYSAACSAIVRVLQICATNSLEQLCINHANEKLQHMFNEHIFEGELRLYASEGLDAEQYKSVYPDNAPCVRLVEAQRGQFVGIMPLLVQHCSTGQNEAKEDLDKLFCADIFRRFGRDAMQSAKNATPGLKGVAAKWIAASSKLVSGKRGTGNSFFKVNHFAGQVKYTVSGFVQKNKDEFPEHLRDAMQRSSNKFVQSLFVPKSSPTKLKTIASKFIKELAKLEKALKATEPHYIRCIKPNDFKMRPIDGQIAFDALKIHRQLQFAGVLEVCRIRKLGYPFRETYHDFWTKRVVAARLHELLALPATMDARLGVETVCTRVLPAHTRVFWRDGEAQMSQWLMGKSMIFAKDDTLRLLQQWHQKEVSHRLRRWFRQRIIDHRISRFHVALTTVQNLWKQKMLRMKYGHALPAISLAQDVVRCVLARAAYLERSRRWLVCKHVQKKWRAWHNKADWTNLCSRLISLKQRVEAATLVQRAWRKAEAARLWRALSSQMISFRSKNALAALTKATLSRALRTAARDKVIRILSEKLWRLRFLVRAQAHMRGFTSRRRFATLSHKLRLDRTAESAVNNIWTTFRLKSRFLRATRAVGVIQTFFRKHSCRLRYLDTRGSIYLLQAWWRGCQARAHALVIRNYVVLAQRFWMLNHARAFYVAVLDAADTLTKIIRAKLHKNVLRKWVQAMDKAALSGDEAAVQALLTCKDERFHRLRPLCVETVPGVDGTSVQVHGLVNHRNSTYWTTPLHLAARSGSLRVVRVLLHYRADPEARDALRQTPLHCSVACGDSCLEISKLLVARSTMWSAEFRGVRDIVNAQTVSGCTPLDLALRYEPQATQRLNGFTENSALASLYLHFRTGTAADHSPQTVTSRVEGAASTIMWLREHGARTARVDSHELATKRHRRQHEEDMKASRLRSRQARFRTRQSVTHLKQSAMFPLMRPQSARSRPAQLTASRGPRARQSDTPANASHAAPYSRLMRALANIAPPVDDRRVGAKTEAASASEYAPQHLVLASKTAFLRRQLNRAAAHPSRHIGSGTERLDSDGASAELPTSAADILARARSTERRERRGLDYGVAWRALWRILNAMQAIGQSRDVAQVRHSSWFYKNGTSGSEYGPFSTKRMQAWQRKGYFSSNLRVRHVGKLAQPFMSIEELFGRSSADPFAAIGTVDELYFYTRDLTHAVKVLGSKKSII